jgi:hypothetical protein
MRRGKWRLGACLDSNLAETSFIPHRFAGKLELFKKALA